MLGYCRLRDLHPRMSTTTTDKVLGVTLLSDYRLLAPQVPGLAQTQGKPTCSNRRLVFAFLSILPYHELVS